MSKHTAATSGHRSRAERASTSKGGIPPLRGPYNARLMRSGLSIRVIVALLMVTPVLVIAALLVILSSVTAHRIAEDLGAQLVQNATVDAEGDIREYLSSAVRISDLYARRIERGELPTT